MCHQNYSVNKLYIIRPGSQIHTRTRKTTLSLFSLNKQVTFTPSRGVIYFPSLASSSRRSSLPFWWKNTARMKDTSPDPHRPCRHRRPKSLPGRARMPQPPPRRERRPSWIRDAIQCCCEIPVSDVIFHNTVVGGSSHRGYCDSRLQ